MALESGEQVRVGLIVQTGGGAFFGEALRSGTAAVVGVACPDLSWARQSARLYAGAAAFADLHGLLASAPVDAVVVEGPATAVADDCLAAVRAGRHLLAPFPLASDAPTHDAIARAAAGHQVVIRQGMSRRSDPRARDVASLAAAGAFGEPPRLRGELALVVPPDVGTRAWVDALAARALAAIDLARLWLGPVASASGDVDLAPAPNRQPGLANIILGHDRGTSVLHFTRAYRGRGAEAYVLEGPAGRVRIDADLAARTTPWGRFRLRASLGGTIDTADDTSAGGAPATTEIDGFVADIRAGAEPLAGLEQARHNLEALTAALLSSLEHARLSLPLSRLPSLDELLARARGG